MCSNQRWFPSESSFRLLPVYYAPVCKIMRRTAFLPAMREMYNAVQARGVDKPIAQSSTLQVPEKSEVFGCDFCLAPSKGPRCHDVHATRE